MDRKLTAKEYLLVASMILGMFFGAGNLIFPVHMGQQAGQALWPAALGFCLTGVGLPLLGIAAMGRSQSSGVFQMSCRLGRGYGYFFTCALYLVIGPLFAIPRTATVSFSVGVAPLVSDASEPLWLLGFSALFFLGVLFFSLRPSGILTWIGKLLNPLFLAFLGILALIALLNPMGSPALAPSTPAYATGGLFQGILDGYNTLDAPAALAFGIVMIDAIRSLGVTSPKGLAAGTLKAGALAGLLMAAIYVLLTVMGAQSRTVYGISADGGEALSLIGTHYLGTWGGLLLGITVTLACLKTSVGLITSCAAAFTELFPGTLGSKGYTLFFCLASFGIANFGLSRIIQLSLPALMFLYPLTITLIFLCLCGSWFAFDRRVFFWVTACTLPAAVLDFLNALPEALRDWFAPALDLAGRLLPFSDLGMGWLVPALLGLAIGLILRKVK